MYALGMVVAVAGWAIIYSQVELFSREGLIVSIGGFTVVAGHILMTVAARKTKCPKVN